MSFKQNKISRCPYCGNLINIFVSDFSAFWYWQNGSFADLPSKVNMPSNKINVTYDQLVKNKKPPISIKTNNMFKKSLDKQIKIKKHFLNNKCINYFIPEGILVCDCLKSTGCIPKEFAKSVFSFKPGYNEARLDYRQRIVNSKCRRKS